MPSTYQYLLLWLSVSLVSLETQPVVVDSLWTDYASLCPSSACNSTQTQVLTPYDHPSCCQRCSCAPDCYKVANCCPDVPLSTSREPEYPCSDIAKLLNDGRQVVQYKKYGIKYRVINTCPDQNITQAFPGCQHPVTLQDHIPVSDKMYDNVYRNRHCAICHGAQEYIVWNLTTECAEIESASFETFEERDEYILNNCAIMAFPPEPKKADTGLSRCYVGSPKIIDSCNITMEWDNYDQRIEKACHRINMMYNTVYTYVREDDWTTMFSNVYCFLCNKPTDFHKSYNCKLPSVINSRGQKIGFSALVNFWSVDTSRDAGQCRSTDIWDPFDAVCRSVLCPNGTIPVFGSCQSSSVYSEGYQLALVFEVTFTTTKTVDSPGIMLNNIIGPLVDKVTGKLGPKFQCGRCDSSSFHYLNETNVYIDIPFYTTKYCSRLYLIGKLQELVFRKKLKFSVNTAAEPLHVILKATLRDMDYEERRYLFYASTNRYETCQSIVQLNTYNIQLCPRVQLLEYNWNLYNPRHLKRLLESTATIDPEENTALVCIDDYFLLREAMRQTSHGCKQSIWNRMAVISLSLSVYVSSYMNI